MKQINKYFHKFVWYSLTVIAIFALADGAAQLFEDKTITKGEGGKWITDDTLGYKPQKGFAEITNNEFQTFRQINSYGMNDAEIDSQSKKAKVKIMVVGDSHSYAVGVSTDKVFSHLLEKKLFKGQIDSGSVYNCAMTGYSLSQYLLKYRQMREVVPPQLLIIGFSMATDLHDLIPPRKGGFVYGSEFTSRIYHDLDSNNNLVEKIDLVGTNAKNIAKNKEIPIKQTHNIKNRNLKVQKPLYTEIISTIKSTALFRRLRESDLVLYVARYIVSDKFSFWEGLEPAIRINLSPEHQYRWLLADRLLQQIKKEAKEQQTKVILLNIAYAPVIYDELWDNSFGLYPQKYNRFICAERLAEICKKYEIDFIDTTPLFKQKVKENNRWLHYKKDRHPTEEGHLLIADTLTKFINSRFLKAQ
jgi:hypothetical protein